MGALDEGLVFVAAQHLVWREAPGKVGGEGVDPVGGRGGGNGVVVSGPRQGRTAVVFVGAEMSSATSP